MQENADQAESHTHIVPATQDDTNLKDPVFQFVFPAKLHRFFDAVLSFFRHTGSLVFGLGLGGS
jgi:hypothetical protein